MPQNPVNRAGKEQFVVISRRWKRHMKEVVLDDVRVGLVVGSVLTTVVMSYLPLSPDDGKTRNRELR